MALEIYRGLLYYNTQEKIGCSKTLPRTIK